jgi:hypothetical protein
MNAQKIMDFCQNIVQTVKDIQEEIEKPIGQEVDSKSVETEPSQAARVKEPPVMKENINLVMPWTPLGYDIFTPPAKEEEEKVEDEPDTFEEKIYDEPDTSEDQPDEESDKDDKQHMAMIMMMLAMMAVKTQPPEELDLCPVSPDDMEVDATSRNKGWRKTEVTVDSGAAHSVMDGDTLPGIPREESESSRQGKVYVGPGLEKIPNRGQKKLRVRTAESMEIKGMTMQDAKVRKPLAAVSGLTAKGNGVWFDDEIPSIIPSTAPEMKAIRALVQQAKNRISLEQKRGVFVMPVWIQTEEEANATPFPRPGM